MTNIKRLRECGLPLGNGDVVARQLDGVHHFVGICTCGSGWVCPVCAAKIRFRRANEVARAVAAAIEKGYGAAFVTRTIPHSAEDELKKTLNLLGEGRRWVTNQRQIKQLRKRLDYKGGIAAKEITYGANGWHPHTHDIELFGKGKLEFQDEMDLRLGYFEYLNKFYTQNGHRELSPIHGVKVDVIRKGDGNALSAYVAKLQEGASVGNEMTRADLKKGRNGSMLPFDIAAEFFNSGDMDMLDLWHEYEKETKGKSVIRFTKGLRKELLPDEKEKSDEELAAEEIGGNDAVKFKGWFYKKIAAIPGLEGKCLRALDNGGFGELVKLLTIFHLDYEGNVFEVKQMEDDEECQHDVKG